MSRYVFKFSKEGAIRYISHLDLLRLFKRSFKRAGIRLQYSQGFNPHPKMSFAQPLSLGYSSTGEYLEFDTTEPYSAQEVLAGVNAVMPEGIHILSCRELPGGGKTLAALTKSASYEISIPLPDGFVGDLADQIKTYMGREQILVMKHQKKSGKTTQVDIKPMILNLNGEIDDKYIMLSMELAAGSTANLSPEMILTSFCESAGLPYERADVLMKRTELYFENN